MKRTGKEPRPKFPSWEAMHPSPVSGTTGPSTAMRPTRGFTTDELRNMLRPPGDYSGVDTRSCPEAATFLNDGILPSGGTQRLNIVKFCTQNYLIDAFSFYCVQLGSPHYLINMGWDPLLGNVEFLHDWAQTIDFEITLDLNEYEVLIPIDRVVHAFQRIGDLPAVTSVNVHFHQIESKADFQCTLLKAIKNNSTLKKLKIWHIKDGASDYFHELIRNNSNLTHLDVDLFYEKKKSVSGFRDLIAANTSLRSLQMNMCASDRYLPLYCTMFEKNSGLESLSLENGSWRIKDACALARALEQNKHLRTLIITSFNWETFSHSSVAVLLNSLKSNTNLTSLTLDYRTPSESESESDYESDCDESVIASALGEFIRTNKTLEYFRLACLDLKNTSAAEIAQALPFNSGILTLDLECEFDEVGNSAIMRSLSTDKSKSALLNLCMNSRWEKNFPFSTEDIAGLIQYNRKIESIGVCVSSHKNGLVCPEGLNALSAAVQSNHTLIDFALLITDHTSYYRRRMQKIFDQTIKSTLIDAVPHQPGRDYEEIVSKVRANAEARSLRLGTVLALGVLAPNVPTEVCQVIADKLIFRDETHLENSGTVAMRSLANMVGED